MTITPPQAEEIYVRQSARMLATRLFAKRNPLRIEDLSDLELLSIALHNRQAAEAVLARCGSLANLASLESGQTMIGAPNVGPATAAQLEVLFELAARIAEGAEQ